MATIEATITLEIVHRTGPEITDPRHVAGWLCADGIYIAEGVNGFGFAVCPQHADPEECDDSGEVSTFFATIVTVDTAGTAES